MTAPAAVTRGGASRFGAIRRLPLSFFLPVAFLVLLVFMAVFAGAIAPYDPLAQNPPIRLQPPSAAHIMGTDEFGRDVYSRVIYGARISIVVGVAAVFFSSIIGSTIGLLAGYVGGARDETAMRLMDVVIAFPAMVLAIALIAAAGAGLANVIVVIAIVQLPVFARLARSSVLAEASRDYVMAARVLGVGPAGIVVRHLLPNSIAPSVTMVGLLLADAILIESALSFLGLGVLPPTPTWGNILASGREYILIGAWWFTVFPGFAIFLTVLSINLLADFSRDRLDPTHRTVTKLG